jgi:beta-aspartyl-peptidase (threonine type)
VSATGHGERIIPVVMSKRAADLMGEGLEPQEAAEQALATLRRVKGVGGLITLDRQGRVGVAWSTPAMAYAFRAGGSDEFDAGT